MNLLKTTLSILIAFLFVGNVWAQFYTKQEKVQHFKSSKNANHLRANDYSFSHFNGTYTNLTGTTSVNNNLTWDDPEYIIPIGFNFQLFDKNITNLYMGIGTGALLADTIDANFESNYLISAFEADLQDRSNTPGTSLSPISYKVDGTAGSRIFKLEFKNAGFYNELDSLLTLNDYVNFQIWLYEGSNTIEFHYGPRMISFPFINFLGETGAIIGLSDFDILNAYIISGPVANPSLTNSFAYINGSPTNGKVYRFTKNVVGINEMDKNKIAVTFSPNPFTQNTKITFSGNKPINSQLKISDVLGKTIHTITNIENNQLFTRQENMSSGIYFYQLIENNAVVSTGKFVVE